MPIVTPANAWFTDSQANGIQIEVKVGDLKLSLYHTSKTANNLIYTNSKNEENESDSDESTVSKYIPLNKKVEAGVPADLKLIVSNEETDSIPMYVKFKFELYSRGIESDELITTNLTVDAPTGSANGWVLNAGETDDGYYYLQDANGNDVVLNKNMSLTLFTKFTIPMSEFISNGQLGLTNSDTLYIKFYIFASIYPFNAATI